MKQPFGGIMPEGSGVSIEPFEYPTIKEILAQQRMILGILNELMKVMVHSPILYKSKESKNISP